MLTHLEVEAEHGWHLVLRAQEDGDCDGDGDDVEQLDALVQVDQPQHAATRVAVRHLQEGKTTGSFLSTLQLQTKIQT